MKRIFLATRMAIVQVPSVTMRLLGVEPCLTAASSAPTGVVPTWPGGRS